MCVFAAFGGSYGTAPTSAAASMAVTSGAYTEYGQMPLASQATTPGAAPGTQPRLDTPAAPDYSAYGKIFLFCCYCFVYILLHKRTVS